MSVGPNGRAAVVLWSRGERSQNLCLLKIGSRILLDQPLPLTSRNTLELIADLGTVLFSCKKVDGLLMRSPIPYNYCERCVNIGFVLSVSWGQLSNTAALSGCAHAPCVRVLLSGCARTTSVQSFKTCTVIAELWLLLCDTESPSPLLLGAWNKARQHR